jgi:hypothetical protein
MRSSWRRQRRLSLSGRKRRKIKPRSRFVSYLRLSRRSKHTVPANGRQRIWCFRRASRAIAGCKRTLKPTASCTRMSKAVTRTFTRCATPLQPSCTEMGCLPILSGSKCGIRPSGKRTAIRTKCSCRFTIRSRTCRAWEGVHKYAHRFQAQRGKTGRSLSHQVKG